MTPKTIEGEGRMLIRDSDVIVRFSRDLLNDLCDCLLPHEERAVAEKYILAAYEQGKKDALRDGASTPDISPD